MFQNGFQKKRYHLILGLLILLGCSAAIAANRALLVGINNYPYVGALSGPINDVQIIRQFALDTLHYSPDEIKVLIDSQATRNGILKAIEHWLIEDTQPGDRILFYYSGHGYQMPDTNGDERDRLDETLVSYDTRPGKNGSFYNMISDDELRERFDRLSNRYTTIIIDSCHSGTATRGLLQPKNTRAYKMPNVHPARSVGDFSQSLAGHRHEKGLIKGHQQRVVWSAVSAAQVALVDIEVAPRNSVFTRRFLEGLRNRKADYNNNGVVSYAELLSYVQKESAAYCQRHETLCPLGLTPTLEIEPAYSGQPAFAFDTAPTTLPKPAPYPTAITEWLAHDNTLGIQLEIIPRARVQLGEATKIRVTSPKNGYLVILDQNANGELLQIFPNRYSDKAGKTNRIAAHRPITIPDPYYGFEFRAREPVGQGQLIAIVSEDPVFLDDLLAKHKDLATVPRPNAYLGVLSQRLQQTWTGGRFNRQARWSQVEVKYEIYR